MIGTTRKWTRDHFLKCFGEEYPYDRIRKTVDDAFVRCRREGKIPLKPGARQILDRLDGNGLRLALASSTYREIVEPEMEAVGLLGCFEQIVCGDEILNGKPAPDIFLEAAARLRVDPADCLVLEDSINGVRSACSAGMPVIMIPDVKQPDDEIRMMAAAICPDLASACERILNGEIFGGKNE